MHTPHTTARPVSRRATIALENWEYCFQLGYYTAARSWWALYEQLRGK